MGDILQEMGIYCILGNVYRSHGDLKKAVHYHERHLEIARKVRDVSAEGTAYGNLGNDYHQLGDLKKAINYHEQSLEIARKVGDVSAEETAYDHLGCDCYKLGDFKKAINYHEQSLEIARNVGDVSAEGTAYGNLGYDYHALGDFTKAIYYNKQSLEISRKVGDVSAGGTAYGRFGNAYLALRDFEKGIHYHEQSLVIARKVGSVIAESSALFGLGNCYLELGESKTAIYYYEQCLDIERKVGNVSKEGRTYCNLGNAYHALGDLKKAVQYYEQSLVIARELEEKVVIGSVLHNLGTVFQSMGSSCKAVEYHQHSIKTMNDVRRDLAFNDDWKVSLRNLYQNAYVSLWRLLLKQGKIVEALLSAEQGRAQALNDLMEFKYASKQYRAESGTEIETIADIVNGFPSSTIFLALEQQELIFWVFQKGKDVQFRRKRIPPGQFDAETFLDNLMRTTKEKIRGTTVVKCEDRSLDRNGDENLSDESSPPKKRQNQSINRLNSDLSVLYETIICPVQDLLLENEVIFVPEGPLCLAPFAAFMNSDSKYLCESFRIRVIPSLTSLKFISDCPADYHIKRGALIVGDPWIQDVTFEGTTFKQLEFAREEAQMIGRILDTTPLIGEHATKNEVLKRLSSVALVHIAAHGRMATGEIALAPNPSPVSRSPGQEDFVLTMRDVLSAEMRAKLVVLSCCHSACGEIKAEGVVGIARAFLGAGARSVLVSLWAINDQATMEFMKIFYQHLVKGESASTALNQAMKSMRESDEFTEVKYWAPFVLIGDDVTLELGEQE